MVIAIPALMILITLTAGIISYELILEMADHTESLTLKAKLEGAGNTILMANLVACVIALVFGVGLATYIIRPIRVITQKARRIARGDLSKKIQITNPDEIGDLGDSFNSLIDQLNHLFKERDRYILEGFFEGLISTGAGGEVLAVNSQAEKILGLRAEEMIGEDIDGILEKFKQGRYESTTIGEKSDSHTPTLNSIVAKSLREHIRLTVDKLSFTNAQNQHYSLSVTTSPIKDKHGNRMGCIITLRDLAILASFAQQMQRADRLAAIGSFATGIAHEIRNPLGSIKGVAQLLSENPEGDRIKNYTELIVAEVDRLDRVIRTILDFAQPEPEEARPICLNEVLQKALQMASHHPSVDGALTELEIDLNLADIPQCLVQPMRLTQAFNNMILNALQAVKPGGFVRIESIVAQDGIEKKSFVEVNIRNNGPPIAPEHREKIFEPFFTTRTKGTGLGLPISYQIIVFNGGTVHVDSDSRETVFHIRFPVTKGEEEAPERIPPSPSHTID